MRAVQAGLMMSLMVASLAIGMSLSSSHVQAQRPVAGERGAETLIAIPGPESEGRQSLVVIDRYQQTMASYHIDSESGQINLRCVRSVRGDLQMDNFNGTEPSPEKIQALLQAR